MEKLTRCIIAFVQRRQLSTVRAWGRFVGDLVYFLARERRKTALQNLDYAYGDSIPKKEKRRIARASFQNLVITGFEFAYSPKLGPVFADYVDLIDAHHFWEAYDKQNGVIVIVTHSGNWEVISRFFAYGGVTMHAVTRMQKQPWVAKIVKEIRTSNGFSEIDKKSALLPVLRALKRREAVCLLIDQHARKDAVLTQFFDKPAMTVGSAALVALRTDCAAMLAVSFRHPDGRIAAQCRPLPPTVRTGDVDQDILTNTQNYVNAIEEAVRDYPESWMWMHRRWRFNQLVRKKKKGSKKKSKKGNKWWS